MNHTMPHETYDLRKYLKYRSWAASFFYFLFGSTGAIALLYFTTLIGGDVAFPEALGRLHPNIYLIWFSTIILVRIIQLHYDNICGMLTIKKMLEEQAKEKTEQ
ncbi:TPA: hypothetical protein DF272_03060 [Candidatus Falkowbacteria bacterium]|nr:hypothetical protein [Candidatus Falkowbacteria bacterium]